MKKLKKEIDVLAIGSKTWLITGVAGFIGSNLLEALLSAGQNVIGVDNFSTGLESNLIEVENNVTSEQWNNFMFYKGDICDYSICSRVVKNCDYVLHQAALGSVSRSIQNPIATNSYNITGFVNILEASRNANVKSFTYASSSSVYGDAKDFPRAEAIVGSPLSPYAVTKHTNELYAKAYANVFNFRCIGLRYFNVFGPRQNPRGEFSAVIPRWIKNMLENKEIEIFGDGSTTRDFCYIDNVVQANILASLASDCNKDSVYNIAVGEQRSLNTLYKLIKDILCENGFDYGLYPVYKEFRLGDIRSSLADISEAKEKLRYLPTVKFCEGIDKSIRYYLNSRNYNSYNNISRQSSSKPLQDS